MKKLFLILAAFVLIASLGQVYAQDEANKTQSLQEEIRELEKKITESQDKSRTLSSQINYMDSQIRLTELQITDTQTRIDDLEVEIATLSGKIEKLEISLNQLSQLLLERIAQTYKKGKFSTLDLIFSLSDFSSLLNRLKYIQMVQTHDKNLLYQIQNAKNTFTEKKILREEKKEEQILLSEKLEKQKVTLDAQKKEKVYLLSVTKNDEKRYQDLKSQALAELNQIQQAAAFLKSGGTPVNVKKGDIVGTQGNTGYSTGEHLHFGVYNYSSIDNMPGDWYHSNYVDPSSVLTSRSVTWDESCGNDGQKTIGSGSWNWPHNGDFRITQGFGYTCYSQSFYNGNPHPAYDIVGDAGTAIRAVEEGKAYFCRNCLGDGGNGVFIFHPSGKMTLYWHLR